MDRIEQIRKRLKATVAMEATQVDSEKFWNHAYTDIAYLLKRLDEREKEIAMYMHIQCSADNCCTSGRDCSGGRTHPNHDAQPQEA